MENRQFKGMPLEVAMEDAKFKMRTQLNQNIDFTELASSLNLGYSYFRKMFKKHTGVSPGQYHLHLRIMKARELLASTDLPIKQVAVETGFESIHYFSRLFKNKMATLLLKSAKIKKGLCLNQVGLSGPGQNSVALTICLYCSSGTILVLR